MIEQPTRAYLAPTLGPPSEGGVGMLWQTALGDEQPVIVLPADTDTANITPATALTILARSEHPCRGFDQCGYCRSVEVLARALFPGLVAA